QADRAAREQFEQAEKSRNDARVEYGERKGQLARASQEVARLSAECGQVYGELPAEHRARVSPQHGANWLTTTWPVADDRARRQAEAGGLEAARQQRARVEKAREMGDRVKAREEAVLANLQRLRQELPDDHQAVRQQFTSLKLEEQQIEADLKARRAELKE